MRIICILFFFLLFHIIFSQDLEYEIYTFDEMINNIMYLIIKQIMIK